MSTTKQLNAALRTWAEVFMARSMHEWIRFVKGSGLSMPQFSTLMRLHHHGVCGVSDACAKCVCRNVSARHTDDGKVVSK